MKLFRRLEQCHCWIKWGRSKAICMSMRWWNTLCSDCKNKPNAVISAQYKKKKPDGLRADFVIVDEIHDCKAAISERWISKSERNLEKLVKEIEYYLTENKVTVRGMSGEKLIFTDQETGEEYVVQDLGYPI